MANEITIRVYEQGQQTVLNGGGAGTQADRGAAFSAPVPGLSVGQHTLEVTAQDTAAGKTESSRVSAGTITIDASGYSDDFNDATARLLTAHNNAWGDAGNWRTEDATNWRVSRVNVDGGGSSGCARAGDWWTRGGARYMSSSSLISQVTIKPIINGGADPEQKKGPIVCAGGSPAYFGYALLQVRPTAASNWTKLALTKDGNVADPGGYWVCDSVSGLDVNYQVDHVLRLVATVEAGATRLSMYLDGNHVNVDSAQIGDGFQYDSGTGDVIDPSGHSPFTSGNPGFITYCRNCDPTSDYSSSLDNWQDY